MVRNVRAWWGMCARGRECARVVGNGRTGGGGAMCARNVGGVGNGRGGECARVVGVARVENVRAGW